MCLNFIAFLQFTPCILGNIKVVYYRLLQHLILFRGQNSSYTEQVETSVPRPGYGFFFIISIRVYSD
jgi:hypothetical protein